MYLYVRVCVCVCVCVCVRVCVCVCVCVCVHAMHVCGKKSTVFLDGKLRMKAFPEEKPAMFINFQDVCCIGNLNTPVCCYSNIGNTVEEIINDSSLVCCYGSVSLR